MPRAMQRIGHFTCHQDRGLSPAMAGFAGLPVCQLARWTEVKFPVLSLKARRAGPQA